MCADENPSADTEKRVSAIVNDVLRRRLAGENIGDEAILAAHPELADELQLALDKARLVAAAAERAKGPASETQAFERGSTPRQQGTLVIRCPHCREPIETTGDTLFTDITCEACGSSFSLIGSDEETRSAPPLKSVGRFDLIERIGVGGFGVVWKGRDRELDRAVAIKIPRHGVMEDSELERFLREARAAAQLKHPNIVRVFEVGREGDLIYIVSDLVRGVTLDDWLTGQQPTMRQAAEMCVKIADALHHAHENGIIHRDLKPSNIMVDGDGEPHLMDFGLARREVGEVTMTIDGAHLGTPAYMSPEQAAGEGHTADRRTDIYSLGVILFELLTGERPFRGNRQMLMYQAIHDEPPSPKKLNATIPKDLETITLKCIEKEPSQRYQTAIEVKDELQRFLSGQAILARPIGRLERVWRSAGRRPAIMGLSGLIGVLSLILAVGGPAMALRQAALKRKAEMSRIEAESEAAKAIAISKYLQQLLASTNPDAATGTNYTVRQLLDDSSSQLLNQLTEQPEVKATIHATIGKSYWRLGVYDAAEPHLKEALAIRKNIYTGDDERKGASLVDYSWNLTETGRHDAALKCVTEALAIYRRMQSPPERLLEAKWVQQRILMSMGRSIAADAVARDAIASHENPSNDNYLTLANILHGLADSLFNQGDFVQAEAVARNALALHERYHGREHPETAFCLSVLGRSMACQGKYQDSIPILDRSIAIFSRQFGDTHKNTRFVLAKLHQVHFFSRGQFDLATLAQHRFDSSTINSVGTAICEAIAGAEAFVEFEQWQAAVDTGSKLADQIEHLDMSTMNGDLQQLASAYNGKAWNLATTRDAKRRQPQVALELSAIAMKICPTNHLNWNALGVIQYRAGKFSASRCTLKKSMELRDGGNSWDWFVLAMAEWELGNKAAAHEWYSKAISWMDLHADLVNDDLTSFREEATTRIQVANSLPSISTAPAMLDK